MEAEDGTSRLLDFGNRFYGLSGVATRMLRAALDTDSETAVEQLAREYGEPIEHIRADLMIFLTDLKRKRLIQQTNDHHVVTPLVKVFGCMAVIPMLWLTRLVPWQRAKAWLLLALAWLNCRLLGWTHTVGVWQIGYPHRAVPASNPEAAMRTIDATVCSTAASHPLPVECKERALTTWALARIAGMPVELVVGVHPFPLEGHCWCACNGAVYSDDSERCAQFKPVWRCS